MASTASLSSASGKDGKLAELLCAPVTEISDANWTRLASETNFVCVLWKVSMKLLVRGAYASSNEQVFAGRVRAALMLRGASPQHAANATGRLKSELEVQRDQKIAELQVQRARDIAKDASLVNVEVAASAWREFGESFPSSMREPFWRGAVAVGGDKGDNLKTQPLFIYAQAFISQWCNLNADHASEFVKLVKSFARKELVAMGFDVDEETPDCRRDNNEIEADEETEEPKA